MSILEIAIFFVMFTFFVLKISAVVDKKIIRIIPFVIVILIVLNLTIDGYRWQMVPIYLFSIVVSTLSIISMVYKPIIQFKAMKKVWKIISVISIGLIFLLTLAFPALLPVNDLLEPSGPYDVGTTSYRLVDNSREEIFTEDADDVREFLVSVWYPADVQKEDEVKTYWDEDGTIGKAFSENSGLGSFFFSHLSLVKTNSYIDASVSGEKELYPVIIYSHGFNGQNTDNTMLFESLASEGYIVFAINHTYESVASLFPDGEFISSDFEYLFNNFDSNSEDENTLLDAYNATDDVQEQKDIINQFMTFDDQMTEMVKIRTEDAKFLLDEMDSINSEYPIINSKLDLSNIGMMGYSLGGATTQEVCVSDIRIKSCVNIDGWPYGELFNDGNSINLPFLYINSETQDDMGNDINTYVYDKLESDAYHIIVEGAEHPNFLDFPYLLKNFKYLGFWGPIDPEKLQYIENDFVLGFFNIYLKNEDVDLEEIANNYNEVTFTSKNILD